MPLDRIVVVGTSGCGKTTFARQLAEALGFSCLELDTLFWLPGWRPRNREEFRKMTGEFVEGETWVIDGNYGVLRDIIWPRATHIIWLNYRFSRTLWQVTRRTLINIIHRREVFPGCPETFQNVFLNRDSIIWWTISTYHPRKRKYEIYSRGGEFPHLKWIEFGHPRKANEFLASLKLNRWNG
jgi:adenylate kinase family enzyme